MNIKLPNPFVKGQKLKASELEDMRKVIAFILTGAVVAGPGLLSEMRGGKMLLSAERQKSSTPTPPHPFKVDRKTGLTGTVNGGHIQTNNLNGGSGALVFDTEFLDTSVPVPGNFRFSGGDVIFDDESTTAVLIKATYNSWVLPDDGEVRSYNTGYTLDKDICTFDVNDLTMANYFDSFEWPNTGGAQTKYFPVAIVQTSGGQITTILQILKNDFIDPFAYLTSTQLPAP